jgi:hypothetical protein
MSTLAVFTDRSNEVLIIGVMLLISGETPLFLLRFKPAHSALTDLSLSVALPRVHLMQ